MSEFQASNFKKENGGTPNLVGKTELTSPYYFVPPSGTTAERPQSCAPGTIRFNTDVGTLEVYRGDGIGWEYIEKREDQYLGGANATGSTSTSLQGSTVGTGARGLFGGSGDPASGREQILYLTIPTTGNTLEFGSLTSQIYATAGLGSRTRGVFGGGYNPSQVNTMEFVTFSSRGSATDFGDTTYKARDMGGLSSSTRGLFFGGISTPSAPSGTNVINYITISHTGNATDFGDAHAEVEGMEGLASSTRGLIMGGSNPSGGKNNISFVTISTTGNSADFGDMQASLHTFATGSNATRGMIGGGRTPATASGINNIQYVTIATKGNAHDFGDLTVARSACDGVSDPTRFVVLGGYNPSNTNIIDFVNISSTGDATDFGDSTYGRNRSGSCSNGHGGL